MSCDTDKRKLISMEKRAVIDMWKRLIERESYFHMFGAVGGLSR
jgi:hypothetical protein